MHLHTYFNKKSPSTIPNKETRVKRSRKNWMSGVIAFSVTLLMLTMTPRAEASIAGSDNASDAAYSGNYNGQNGGGGFLGAWAITPSVAGGNAGTFIGTSGGNGGGGGPGIDSAGSKAWGIYANNNNTAQGLRTFTGSLINGQSFSIDMDSGFDNNNSSGGFGLQNVSGGLNRFEFFHKAGQANYQINDSVANFNTGIPFTDGGLRIVFTLTAANTYNVTITRLNGATVTTFTGRTLGGTAGTGIDRLRIFRFDDSVGGGAENYYFNNISINCNGGPSTAISGPATVCSGTQNAYNNTGSNGGTRRWTVLGNGSIVGAANGSSIQVLAGAAGSYSVILTNSEAGCTNVQTANVTVNATPAAPSPSSDSPVCAGATLHLFANATASTYTWTGPNGFTSGLQNPTIANVTTAASGTYNLTITVGGCVSPIGSTSVTVNNAPTCSITGSTIACPSGTSTFTAPAGMSSYAWSISGNGTISGAANAQSVNVIAGPSGSYTITVVITANGCSSTCNQTVTIDSTPPTITCNAPAIANGSFEAGGGAGSQVFTGWQVFGNTFKENFIPRTGTFHAKMFGNFTSSQNFSGIYQDLAAAPGQVWRGDVYALFDSTDTPASGNQAKLRIEFLNSSSTFINGFDSPVLTTAVPKDKYIHLTVTATAPAGTAFVRIVPSYIQQADNAGGSVYFDDASLSRITTVSANGSCQGAIPNVTSLASASDNNPGVTVSQSPAAGTVVGLGNTTVNVIATDACGNQSQCSMTVKVIDDTGPTVTCPANATVECTASTAPANTGTATASDACSNPTTVTSSDATGAGSCAQGLVITRTWYGLDAAGNLSSCAQTITKQDTTGPTLSGVPANQSIQCASDIPASPVHRAWDLYANNGNLSEAIRPLNAALAVGQTLKLDVDNGFVFTGSTVGFGLRNAADENRFELFFVGGDAFYRIKGTGGSVLTSIGFSGEGVHVEVTLTGADTFSVRIVRLQNGAEQTLTGTLGGTAGSAITKIRLFNADSGSGTAFDAFYNNFDIAGVAFDSASSAAYDDGWQSGDNGGSGFGAWQLNPAIDNAFAGNIIGTSTANNGGDSNGDNDIDSFNVTATDNCDPHVAITFGETDNGAAGCAGSPRVITRTWTAKDDCGNTTSQSQTITQTDNTAPVLNNVPASVTVQCAAGIPAAPSTARAWGLYANSGATSEALRPFSNPLTVGQKFVIDLDTGFIDNGGTVGFGLQNALGENRFELFFVGGDAFYRIKGNGASVLTSVGYTGEGLHVEVTLTGADTFSVKIIRIQNNTSQTLTGTLGGTAGSAIDRVRFFNFNAGGGATKDEYFNSISIPGVASDNASATAYNDGWQGGDNGGTGFGAWTLSGTGGSEPANFGRFIGNSTLNDGGDSNGDGDINSLAVTATDNCDPHVNVSFSQTDNGASGCNGHPRIITRTWTAADDCGNTVTQTQTITQEDTQAPVLSGVPANTTVQCSGDVQPPATVTAADNCDATATVQYSATTNGNVITRTWTSTDVCGNTATASQTITIQDTLPPVITCPGDVQVECGTSTAPAQTGSATATDNCDATPTITFSDSAAPGACPQSKTITRTWTATDDAGNSSQCTQIIAVQDTTPPTVTASIGGANTLLNASFEAGNGPGGTFIQDWGTFGNVFHENFIPRTGAFHAKVYGTGNNNPDFCGLFQDKPGSAGQVWRASVYALNPSSDAWAAGNSAKLRIEFFDASNGFLGAQDSQSLPSTTVFDTYILLSVTMTAPLNTDHVRIVPTYIQVNNGSGAVYFDDARLEALQGSASVQCAADVPAPDASQVQAQDNCDLFTAVTHLGDTSNGGAGCPADPLVITRTFRATDACGNFNDASVTITVSDTIAPTLNGVPANTTVECGAVPAPATVTASDNCDASPAVTFSETTTPGACADSYTITRTWTATDDCGNQGTATQTITVQDTTAPAVSANVLSNPSYEAGNGPGGTFIQDWNTFGNVYHENFIPRTGAFHAKVFGTGNNNPDFCGLFQDRPASAGQVWRASVYALNPSSDAWAAGNSAKLRIEFFDASNGFLGAQDSASLPSSTAFDTYLLLSVTMTAPLNTDHVRIVPTYVQVNNGSGAVYFDDAALEVVHEYQCPADVPAPNTLDVHATDACDSSPTVTYLSDTSNGGTGCPASPLVITRTFRATDNCGNFADASVTINVVDTTPPVIACPANVTIQCGSDSSPAATGSATASDNCGAATVTYSDGPSSDGCGNSGGFTRTWTATDACGNQSTCDQVITVVDTTNPTITCPADVTIQCGADSSPAGTGSATGSDNCGAVTITHTDGPYTDGCGNSGGFTRTWKATDECGNFATCDQVITVVDTLPPVITCPANATVECGGDTSPAGTGSATASDNCGAVTVTFADGPSSDGCGNSGGFTRTWTAVDECGNRSMCDQQIAVVDTTAPTVTCPANVTVECGQDTSPAATGSATGSDTCGSVTITHSDGPYTDGCGNSGGFTRTWKATDECGNFATCDQVITVTDTTAPTLSGQGANATIECPASPSFTAPTATDACDAAPVVTFATVTTTGSCPGAYSVTRTWTATDACSNHSSVSQTITVQDSTAPAIACPADRQLQCGDSSDVAHNGSATATDNCTPNFKVDEVWVNEFHYDNTGADVGEAIEIAGTAGINLSGYKLYLYNGDPSFLRPYSTNLLNGIIDNEGCGYGALSFPTGVALMNGNPDGFALVSPSGQVIQFLSYGGTFTAAQGPAAGMTSVDVGVNENGTGPAGASLQLRDVTGSSSFVQGLAYTSSAGTWKWTRAVPLTNGLPSSAGSLNVNQSIAPSACVSGPVGHLTFTDSATAPGCTGKAGVNRTWTATDVCGHSSSCTQHIAYVDTTAPVLSGQGANATIQCPATPVFTAPTATDNCDASPTIAFSDATTAGSCPGAYTVTRTWTATDDCGNSSSVSQTITVVDTTAPALIGVPSNTTAQCDAVPAAATVTATDNCDTNAPVTMTSSTTPGSCPGSYTLTRTWTATDDCGNTSSKSQTITVVDTTAPVLSGQGADATIECPATPSFTAPTASDNCDTSATISFTDSTTAGTCPAEYSVTRTWVAVDSCSNTSAPVSQTITVQDTTGPALVGVPADTTAECDAIPAAATVTAADTCDANVAVTMTESTSAGSCASGYTITRTWTATDDCGNTSSKSQTITVVDTTAPVLSGQGADATIECPASPSFTAPTASDNCDANAAITYSDATTPGSCAGSYSVTRTWLATDACGNESAPVSQTITVVDTTAPTLSGQGADATIECPAAPSFTAPTANDSCDGSPSITFTDSTTPGSCPAAYSVTRTWIATDDCGNQSAPVSQTITVVDTTAPALIGVPSNTTAQCDAVPAAATVTATDNCDTNVPVTMTSSTTTGACPGSYTLTRTWTATDDCGNTSSQSQTITVIDTTAPTLSGQGANATIQCPATPSFTAPTASDNCDGAPVVSFTDSTTPGSCAGSYSVTRTWKATDNCGNQSATVSQTITVVDTTAPTLSGQGANATIECPATPSFTAPTANDSCDSSPSITFTDSTTPGSCPAAYSVTRTWIATDACGNQSAPVSQTITVQDTTGPSLHGVPANTTAQCSSVPSAATVTASDNCDSSVPVTMTQTTTPGSCPGNYTITRTWTATDDCGNSTSQSQTITVQDTTAPTLSGQGANATIQCPASPSFTAPTASDNCDGSPAITYTDSTTAGPCPGSYSVTRTWKATDNCGNQSATVSQTITVVDTTAPTLSGVPSNTTAQCSSVPAPATVTASDSCDPSVPVTYSQTSTPGSCPQAYTLKRVWTATDDCGNSVAKTQTITVVDTTAPVITCPANQTVTTSNCTAGVFFTGATATDNCDTNVTITYSPANGSVLGAGAHTITATATDHCGNSSTCSFTVTVLGHLRVVFDPAPVADDNVDDNIETDNDVLNTFKVGSKIPHKIKLYDCNNNDVTASLQSLVTVKLNVTERQYVNATTSILINDVPENYTGVGSAGGVMVVTGGFFHYNLDTSGYPAGTVNSPLFFRSHVTVEYNSAPGTVVGQEDALLESKP